MREILTDQYFIAGAAVFAFCILALGYYIGRMERRRNSAWFHDGILHFDGPLTPQDVATLREHFRKKYSGTSIARRAF